MNMACDQHNFILDFQLGAGNIHDAQMFMYLHQKFIERFSEIKDVAVDAGYKTTGIMKEIRDSGKNVYL